MTKLWNSLFLVMASVCVVHMKPLEDEKHRALIRTGYIYFAGVGYYRLEYRRPVGWAEARRNCQQEGAALAVVNSEAEANVLRSVYLNYGTSKQEYKWGYETTAGWDEEQTTPEQWATTPPETDTELTTPKPLSTTAKPTSSNGTIHTGFHDLFIEGEYLSVRGEPIIMTGFVRWKPGYPISDKNHNCGAFDINKYILDIPCDRPLPYICEIEGR